VAYSSNFPEFFVEGLRKTSKNLSHHNQCLSRFYSGAPPRRILQYYRYTSLIGLMVCNCSAEEEKCTCDDPQWTNEKWSE
jgi:hypothetical protein